MLSHGVSSRSQPFTYNSIYQLSGRTADIVLTLSEKAVIGSRIGGATKVFRCGLLYTTGGTVRSIFVLLAVYKLFTIKVRPNTIIRQEKKDEVNSKFKVIQ